MSVRWLAAASVGSLLLAGCSSSGSEEVGTPDPADAAQATQDSGTHALCEDARDCDDGLFCTGRERCVARRCVTGPKVACEDGVDCTLNQCDEEQDACVFVPDNSRCEEEQICRSEGCVDLVDPDPDPDPDPGRPCQSDLDCDDDQPCTLDRCGAEGSCLSAAQVDEDGDGDAPVSCGGLDCDDAEPLVHGRAEERCDGLDNDCDGTVDQGPLALCLALDIAGEAYNSELGFRFGSPRDVDGDGVADLAAGGRFTDWEFTGMGYVGVWSGVDGRELAFWQGHTLDALYGHAVLIGGDVNGDSIPEIVASAPSGAHFGVPRGQLLTHSMVDRRLLWSRLGAAHEDLGWDMAGAGDHDADGVEDIFVGAPAPGAAGRVYLLSGLTGEILREFPTDGTDDGFGWYVAGIGLGDGLAGRDLLVGAPSGVNEGGERVGKAYWFSSQSGELRQLWTGREAEGQFGEVVAAVGDLNGDGIGEVAISAPHFWAEAGALEGEVFVFSGADGGELYHWRGRQVRELYGRMVAAAGDLDDDGVPDIAIGAPWAEIEGKEKAGRFEVRSGRTGELLLEHSGQHAEDWMGWHIVRAEHVGASGQGRGLLVSALRREQDGQAGAGALLLYLVGR